MTTMTITTSTITLTSMVLAALFMTAACRGAMPCRDCDDESLDDGPPETPPSDLPRPDLPCGGADLMTDNFNCGVCGHECILFYPDTPYEAGTCKDGVCGPGWSSCSQGNSEEKFNCSEICAGYGFTCVPNGCSGLTGLVFEVDFDGWGCDPETKIPAVKMASGCDELIPWEGHPETHREVKCCCDLQ